MAGASGVYVCVWPACVHRQVPLAAAGAGKASRAGRGVVVFPAAGPQLGNEQVQRRRRPVRMALGRRAVAGASVWGSAEGGEEVRGRRAAVGLSLVAAGVGVLGFGRWARAGEEEASGTTRAELRRDLLAAIEDGGDVGAAIEALAGYSPVRGAAAVAPEVLEGTWRLLWASAGAEVSRATRGLSLPVTSLQLIGEGGGVEAGRAANVLDLFGGAVRLKLSSSAVPLSGGKNVVLIGPPFRLELLLPGGRRVPIGAEETGDSDTSPILGNETNEFAQVYVENEQVFDGRYASTALGDIRCSKVISGDPTVVGSTFVHVRVA